MKMLRIAGLRIAYEELGAGPPVLLLHGSGGSHRQWAELAGRLSRRHRVLCPDLIGYGESEAWPAAVPFDVRAEVAVALGLLELAREPVHVIAHSYGAAVALEAALAAPARVASLALVEPVAFHLLNPTAHAAEVDEVRQLSRRVQEAFAAGDAPGAARRFSVYWLGWPSWLMLPARAKARLAERIGKVALELGGLNRPAPGPEAFASLRAPVLLLLGTRTRAPAARATELCARYLPHARLQRIEGAGHMSPFTHAKVVNELLCAHLGSSHLMINTSTLARGLSTVTPTSSG